MKSPYCFSDQVLTVFDPRSRRVVCHRECRFRGLVLSTSDQGETNLDRAAALLAQEVMEGRLKLKNWDAAVENWIQRVNFVARHCPETEIAAIDDAARKLLLEQICHGAVSGYVPSSTISLTTMHLLKCGYHVAAIP